MVLDTSAVLAFLNRSDLNHEPIKNILVTEPGQLIIPAGILSEICYLIELRLGHQVFTLFFDDLIREHFSLDCGTQDLTDIKRLAERYKNLPLGYSDAAVVCCAVRTTQRIVSLDRRDFQVVQREFGFALLP